MTKQTRTHKRCLGCKKILPLNQFYVAISKKTGYRNIFSRCKPCDIEHHRNRVNKSYKTKAAIMFNGIQSRCKTKNIECDITAADIICQYEKQNGKCHYSGRQMTCIDGDNVMSVDRIDSRLGYVKGNIVLCCWRVNKMKNDLSRRDFLNFCQDICHCSVQ